MWPNYDAVMSSGLSRVKPGTDAVYSISCCLLTCLTGLSSCRNIWLEDGSSTDALVTSSKILNFSWRENQNMLPVFTNTSHSWEATEMSQSKQNNSKMNDDVVMKLCISSFMCACWGILYSLHVKYLSAVLLRFWLRFLCRGPRWRCTGLAESVCWTGSVREKSRHLSLEKKSFQGKSHKSKCLSGDELGRFVLYQAGEAWKVFRWWSALSHMLRR